jgi:hypothetical protein
MPKQAMINVMVNGIYDNLYTPTIAIEPLIKYLNPEWKIWECTDYGNSLITVTLKQNGFDVVGSDIISGFDFLKDAPDFEFDAIVTNPPYSLKDKFLEKCYQYNKPFALLLPLTALEGKHRSNLYGQYGISVIVLDSRIDFTGKKSCWFNVSWFCNGITEKNSLNFEKVK